MSILFSFILAQMVGVEPTCIQLTFLLVRSQRVYICKIGLHSSIRTNDPLVPNQVLYQAELYGVNMVDIVGIEPTHPEGTDLQSAATLQLRRMSLIWWTDGELNPDLCGANAVCSHYHYQPVIWWFHLVTIQDLSIISRMYTPVYYGTIIWFSLADLNRCSCRERAMS